jgi:hypothetical protein
MKTCDIVVSIIYILCGMIAYCAIYIKCRGDVTDVERWLYKNRPISEWCAFRLTSVLVVLGAVFHLRHLIDTVWVALKR